MSWDGFFHGVGVVATGIFGLMVGLGILVGGAYLIDEFTRTRNRVDMMVGEIEDLQRVVANLIKRGKKK